MYTFGQTNEILDVQTLIDKKINRQVVNLKVKKMKYLGTKVHFWTEKKPQTNSINLYITYPRMGRLRSLRCNDNWQHGFEGSKQHLLRKDLQSSKD